MSRRGAVKVNPVTGKMEKMSEEEAGGHRDGCLKLDEKYINAAKDLGLGGAEGMYSHITSLKKMGAADVPTGESIETAGAKKTDRIKASVDVTNTEAVKEAITTHVSTVGKAKIAGFGPTARTATSGIHSHPDSFQHRKGVVNTFGGAKDVTRIPKDEPVRLPARGDKMPGAHLATVSSLDAHAVEGKAKRAAAEAKMKANAAASASDLGGPKTGAIAGFSKTGGVSVIKKPTAAPPRHDAPLHGSGGHTTSTSASARKTMEAIGGHGTVGSGAITDATNGTDAEKRAAFFRKQMAEKAAKTAAAVQMLKGGSDGETAE